jgi:hypothetical protein
MRKRPLILGTDDWNITIMWRYWLLSRDTWNGVGTLWCIGPLRIHTRYPRWVRGFPRRNRRA